MTTLVIVMAVMVAIDRLLSRVGAPARPADATYRRAARARRRADLAARIRRREPAGPASLPPDPGWAATARRRRLGVQPIAVASIVGSVEPHKAAAFDAQWRPPSFTRDRWTLL